jgi:hypothetical protein
MKFFSDQTFNRNLFKRSILQWFLAGILFAIISDKEVLNYFISTETIIQILFFTIVGGFIFFWVTSKIIKKRSSNQITR